MIRTLARGGRLCEKNPEGLWIEERADPFCRPCIALSIAPAVSQHGHTTLQATALSEDTLSSSRRFCRYCGSLSGHTFLEFLSELLKEQ